jgi:hypothetical protein
MNRHPDVIGDYDAPPVPAPKPAKVEPAENGCDIIDARTDFEVADTPIAQLENWGCPTIVINKIEGRLGAIYFRHLRKFGDVRSPKTFEQALGCVLKSKGKMHALAMKAFVSFLKCHTPNRLIFGAPD